MSQVINISVYANIEDRRFVYSERGGLVYTLYTIFATIAPPHLSLTLSTVYTIFALIQFVYYRVQYYGTLCFCLFPVFM
jgi:hypothetical protein